jgi:hypothetical protein
MNRGHTYWEIAMLSRIHVSVLTLGLACGGQAAAQDLAARHPAASIDINALTVESDFTVFMHKSVPEEVRRIALRKLWTLIEIPQDCLDLCYEPEPTASGVVRLATKAK